MFGPSQSIRLMQMEHAKAGSHALEHNIRKECDLYRLDLNAENNGVALEMLK